MRSLTRLTALVLLISFVAFASPPLGAAVTNTFRDEFNNIGYSGSDGTAAWAGDWWDSEDQDPSAGGIRVDSDAPIDFVLWFDSDGAGEYAERTADLSAYDTATLSFDYRRRNTDPSFSFKVLASANGPAGPFAEILAIGPGDDAAYVGSGDLPITAYKSASTTIRFWCEGSVGPGKDFYLDNVEISAFTANLPPTADAANGEPYVIYEGDSLTLDGSASSDPELAPLTYAWDLDNDSIFGEPGEPVGPTPLVSWATLKNHGIDDDGSYPIGLQVTDDTLQSGTATTTLAVNNSAPAITVAGAASVDENAVYTLNLSAVDPGNETIGGWTINWGDGTINTVGDVSSTTHVYTDPGFTRNITVSVTDEDGTFIPGEVLVTSLLTDSLFRFDATSGGFLGEFADLNGLDNPIDVEIGPDGLVYVSGFASDDITRYDATTGAFVDQFIPPGSGGLNAPARMVFGPDGNLYVSNYATDEVLRFDGAGGAFIDAFVPAGSGTLDQPDGIAFGVDGNLYVVSGASGEILRYDGASGAFIDNFALIGPGGTGYADLAFGPDSNLYVSSVSLNKVQRFDGGTGVKIDDFVAAGSGGIGGADGLAFGPDGHLYVVGFLSDNVLRYDAATGAFVNEYVSAAIGMNQPINLVFTPAEQVDVTAVNQPPVAVDDTDSTPEDTAATVGVLGNDSDPELDPLVVDSVTQGANGSVVNNGTDVTYTPDPDWNGTDTFTYTVTDGNGGFDTSTVTVTVTPVNDDPVAVDDAATTESDEPVHVWVLGNDTDPDPDGLSVSAVTDGAHGTVTNHAIKVTYAPHPGWSGIDTFTYTISDGNGGSDSAAVTVTVTAPPPIPNRPPDAQDDAEATDEDVAVTVAVLANDSDPDGDAVTVSAVNQGAHGSVTKTATTITYTPEKDWAGIDSFGYTIGDGRGGTATAAVVITVKPVNDGPIARDDSTSTEEGAAVTVSVLANDSDADGDPLTVGNVTPGNYGTTTTDGRKVTYSPSPGWSGTDSFTYLVTDGHGGSDRAVVMVTVEAIGTVSVTTIPGGLAGAENRPPITTVSGETTVAEGEPLRLEITAQDPDGDEVKISVGDLPEWANFVDDGNGEATITGTPGFEADPWSEILISASDGTVTETVTVTVEVSDVNRPPRIGTITFSGVQDDGSFSFTIAASDPDGDSLSIATDGLPAWASLTDNGGGRATINSRGVPDDEIGLFSVVVLVTDGERTVTSDLVQPISSLRVGRSSELTHQAFEIQGAGGLVATSLKPRVASPDPPAAHLAPREGLMVAFGSAVETLRSQVVPAIVLGVVMAWMLIIGVGHTKEEEHGEPA